MIITNKRHIVNIHHNMEALEKDYCIVGKTINNAVIYWQIYESDENRILHIDVAAHPEFGKFYDF